MSVRTDVTLDWHSSPRSLIVAAPSTLITVQELIDTLRSIEYLPYPGADHLSHDLLTWSGGKIQTGATEYSIITLTLNDLKVGFEARGGPSWVECEITEGVVIAKDAGGSLMSPIANNAYVNVSYAKAVTGALLNVTAIDNIQTDIAAMQTDVAFMKAIEEGEWKIESNQMIFYDNASVEVLRVNLFDKDGNPTMENVYRRVPV